VEWSGEVLPHTPACAVVGDWMALVAVAVLFGMVHALNVGYALLATLMGLYLGWLWMATGNLMVPIVAHAVYDFLALLYILRERVDHDGSNGTSPSLALKGPESNAESTLQ
jgi:membrane protease YdiL (CAAX protease family)